MVLELTELSKKYGKKEVLHNVNLRLEKGIYGLLGPNGAGKSTMMNIITGLLKQSKGTVLYDGLDIKKQGAKYRAIIGYLPQDPGLYSFFSGRELLQYFAKLKAIPDTEERITELLELVNLTDDAYKKVGEYSGGMKRRIGIAVALLNRPKLLVMDEPTAGLDPKERIRFRSILSKIKHESIVIISTHIVSDIEHIADTIILMNKGEIIAKESSVALLESIKNKIWYVEVENREVRNLLDNFDVVNAINTDINHTGMRIIKDDCPIEGAKPVYPTLEDIYMYYFRGDED